jgi:glycine C-acetyltransferase
VRIGAAEGCVGSAELDKALLAEVEALAREGRAKAPERIIVEAIPAGGERGPRYRLAGCTGAYLRMNSNGYLGLSSHPALIEAADAAARRFGVGPGAVRFIDGTSAVHRALEDRIARFLGAPAARIFNSAYTANCGLALTLAGPQSYWIGDQLNHNSIIRAMRIAGVPATHRAIYPHNDMAGLRRCLEAVPPEVERVVVIFDGVFSMRGDCAPIAEIRAVAREYDGRTRDGVITVMDDSHGIGALGATGRGTAEHTGAAPDVVVGTFGKAFGVNGGFVAGSQALAEALRQKADTYVYTNPLGAGDCAAALAAVDVCDGPEGRRRLQTLRERTRHFRQGIDALGLESIPGPHPIVPLLVRDTARTQRLVLHLFEQGILVVGLTYPVVPRGDETIRFQIGADHTSTDIDAAVRALAAFTP